MSANDIVALAGRTQRLASTPGVSAWVDASAGTGKTTVLTNRVLALLLGPSDPSRILCLTFTRAAAAEMANRLNERLARWTVMDEGKLKQQVGELLGREATVDDLARARRLFARVLDAPGGMKIETIHAFCQSLLRRFPLEAGVAPHFALMDDRTAAEALAEARDRMLAHAALAGDPSLAEIGARAAESTFGELIQSLVQNRARLSRAFEDGFDAFAERLRRALNVAKGATPESIIKAACAPGGCDEAALKCAADALLQCGPNDVKAGERIAPFLAAAHETRVELFDEYALAFLTREGARRARLATQAALKKAPGIDAVLAIEAERIIATNARRAAAALLQASLALASLGERMLERYRHRKDEGALLDYDDLVLGAEGLLARAGVAPWVLFKLDGGLDHILIDEAQDTNPEQWEVVRRLADEFFAGDGARARGRTIFAVGDPKQSIYSFQRAEPAAFVAMRDHFAAKTAGIGQDFRAVPLQVSFRSTAAVLDVVDAVFAKAPARDGLVFGADGDILHRPARAGHAGLVELWPPVKPEEPDAPEVWELPVEQRPARDPQLRMAQAIAATIKGWVDRREMLPSRGRAIRPGDVLVLVRRRTSFVPALVRALKECGIAVAGSDRMRLVDQLAVEDAMALLQVLILPEDDLTLAAVLKGPLFAFDEEQLFALCHNRGDAHLMAELRRRAGESEAFGRAAALLNELMARADFVPPYGLLAEIMGERGGRERFLAHLGPDAADPLDELMAAALAYERQHGPSLQGFLAWLAAGDITVKRDLDERNRDEVRIMTVHGAKGLEAPIVFLPDTLQVPREMQRVHWTEDGLPLWKAGGDCAAPALDAARAAADQRRIEEYHRLLYVAMTRAADRLYVCGWEPKHPPPQNWHALVSSAMAALPNVERFAFTAPIDDGWSGEGLRLVAPQSEAPKDDGKWRGLTTPEVALPAWAERSAPLEPVPPRPLAPSQPTGAEPAPRSPLGADDGVGFRRGLLVHRLLQTLPQLEPASRAEAARRFLARPVHGLLPEEQAAILAETLAVLADPAFAALFGPEALAEVPVVGLVGTRAISGRIDRLLVTDEAVLIVDYKTLRPAPATEDVIPPIYLEQLRAYRAAVAAIYPGRRVRCALLWTDGPRLMEVTAARLAIDAAPGDS